MFNLRAAISRILYDAGCPASESSQESTPLIQLFERLLNAKDRQLKAKDEQIDSLRAQIFELRLRQVDREMSSATGMDIDGMEDEFLDDEIEEIDLIQVSKTTTPQEESCSEAELEYERSVPMALVSTSPAGCAVPSSPPQIAQRHYSEFRSLPSSRTTGRSDVSPPSSTVGFNDIFTETPALMSSRTSQRRTTHIKNGKRPFDAADEVNQEMEHIRPLHKTIKRLRGETPPQSKRPLAFQKRAFGSRPRETFGTKTADAPKTPENRFPAETGAPSVRTKSQLRSTEPEFAFRWGLRR